MLAAEGQVHKRQRRVATPAFGIQNLRALEPLVFSKGILLKDKWLSLIEDAENPEDGLKLDVCDWISRGTFDVMGSAGMSIDSREITGILNTILGFDYQFNAIENGDNELFRAYKDMFEISIAQARGGLRSVLTLYVPFADWIFVSQLEYHKPISQTDIY